MRAEQTDGEGPADDGHAKRSLSCLMNAHDQCQHPSDPHVKPGCIPGSGGKPCACECHRVARPSNPARWKRTDLDRELLEGYVRRGRRVIANRRAGWRDER